MTEFARRRAAGIAPEPAATVTQPVGWGFISLYTLAYLGTILVFLAPLLVTLALEGQLARRDRPGAEQPGARRAGIGALLAMFANPFFGRMSDRTSSRRRACDDPGW